MKTKNNIQLLLPELEKWYASFNGTIVAFSGGIDSALVLYLSRYFMGKSRTIGVISNSESLKSKDYQLAIDFTDQNDIILETIYTKELADKNYNSNPANRCYFCKSHLYQELESIKSKYPNFVVLNGTNKDDLGDYRPGLEAAKENNVRSPLSELGITKKEVRLLAKHFNIPFWDKPASPCMSSRIPYGESVTLEKLNWIEESENILNSFGFTDVRIRHYGKSCKIEVPLSKVSFLQDLSKEIFPLIEALGFETCTIEKAGLISGNLNKVLKEPYAKS